MLIISKDLMLTVCFVAMAITAATVASESECHIESRRSSRAGVFAPHERRQSRCLPLAHHAPKGAGFRCHNRGQLSGIC
jgi:hypothetical protein